MAETQIENLIPHRAPFMFADTIVEATEERIIATKVFDKKDEWLRSSFQNSDFSYVPGTILLESMAQCGGAGIKLLGATEGLFGLASIESARFVKGAEFDKEVRYEIKNIRINSKLLKQSGIGYIDGEVVVEASWLCVRID